jgi:uncharacterized protein (TIGR02145 family)
MRLFGKSKSKSPFSIKPSYPSDTMSFEEKFNALKATRDQNLIFEFLIVEDNYKLMHRAMVQMKDEDLIQKVWEMARFNDMNEPVLDKVRLYNIEDEVRLKVVANSYIKNTDGAEAVKKIKLLGVMANTGKHGPEAIKMLLKGREIEYINDLKELETIALYNIAYTNRFRAVKQIDDNQVLCRLLKMEIEEDLAKMCIEKIDIPEYLINLIQQAPHLEIILVERINELKSESAETSSEDDVTVESAFSGISEMEFEKNLKKYRDGEESRRWTILEGMKNDEMVNTYNDYDVAYIRSCGAIESDGIPGNWDAELLKAGIEKSLMKSRLLFHLSANCMFKGDALAEEALVYAMQGFWASLTPPIGPGPLVYVYYFLYFIFENNDAAAEAKKLLVENNKGYEIPKAQFETIKKAALLAYSALTEDQLITIQDIVCDKLESRTQEYAFPTFFLENKSEEKEVTAMPHAEIKAVHPPKQEVVVEVKKQAETTKSFDGETVTDIDGNVYTTVKIGKQVWTVENLKTSKYNDGTPIPFITGDSEWENYASPAYCFYDNDNRLKDKYGALYNWYTVKTGKIAPKGWHVPTDEDWTELEKYLIANGYNWNGTKDGDEIAKSMAAKTDWKIDTILGNIGNDLSKNNSCGFTALPGSGRSANGLFSSIGYYGRWWSATEQGASDAWYRDLGSDDSGIFRNGGNKKLGFSVRCLRD